MYVAQTAYLSKSFCPAALSSPSGRSGIEIAVPQIPGSTQHCDKHDYKDGLFIHIKVLGS